MALIVPGKHADKALKKATKLGEKAYLIGEVAKGKPGVRYVEK